MPFLFRPLTVLAVTLLALSLLHCGDASVERATAEADAAPETPAAATDPVATDPVYVEIQTPQGRMVVRLYDETPGHRDNFVNLVNEGILDSTTFHRVIENFMIQGGDPNSKNDDLLDDGQGGPGYTIPAEFVPSLYHKRGALAAARQGDQMNPEKRSSGSQFYIIQGQTFDATELDFIEQQLKTQLQDSTFSFSPEARQAYMAEGGAPNLDGGYTVFGELVEGFDVLDRVASSDTIRRRFTRRDSTLANEPPPDQRLIDQPPDRIPMTVRILEDYAPGS